MSTSKTPSSAPRFFAPVLLVPLAMALVGCGDDSLNPSNPDAAPWKDATVEGGDVSVPDGGAPEAGTGE
jgi:hypothetical protein